ncbi:MAG TPA: YbhB/YbcL family Raf kinase inhibitor-like protein [Steroidobacteraceae bacterium]|nr:YbhB/YbcL family Raf kinase inhibitor-like protein [Steroidobacteraceae bacterium]
MFSISSPAFAHQAPMPRRYTAEGENLSPPLEWSGAPAGAKSVALIMDDPDAPDPRAPQRTYVHWVLYDLPVGAKALPAGASSSGLPPGTRQGLNDEDRAQYSGPAPPVGRHRYFIKLYALDTTLPELEHPTKARLEAAMNGHVLASTELVGTYEKSS